MILLLMFDWNFILGFTRFNYQRNSPALSEIIFCILYSKNFRLEDLVFNGIDLLAWI